MCALKIYTGFLQASKHRGNLIRLVIAGIRSENLQALTTLFLYVMMTVGSRA